MEENKVMEQKIENEDELFHFVEYSPEAAEMIGYSDYSYWKSVFQNFLKKKSAVIMSCVFIGLVVFSFIALAIGKYDYASLVTDSSKAFINPNGEYWFPYYPMHDCRYCYPDLFATTPLGSVVYRQRNGKRHGCPINHTVCHLPVRRRTAD